MGAQTFSDLPAPMRMAIRRVVENSLDCQVAGYCGGLHLRIPNTPTSVQVIDQTMRGYGFTKKSDVFFPLGSDNPEPKYRWHGSYFELPPGFWRTQVWDIVPRDRALEALARAADILETNAELAPDPRMEGATDCYLVSLGDLQALRDAVLLLGERRLAVAPPMPHIEEGDCPHCEDPDHFGPCERSAR